MKIIFDDRPLVMITVNGPGELYYWVRTLLNSIIANRVPIQIWIFLTPCQFSTGYEQKVLQEDHIVTKVFLPNETKQICWGKKTLSFPQRGLILFLGGDIFNAVLLKKKSGYPLWVYGSHLRWSKHVDLYLARFLRDYDRYQFPQKKFIGDLLYSYVIQEKSTVEKGEQCFYQGEPRILFLPGSRSFAYEHLIPFYRKIADLLLPIFPKSSFALGFPSYYSEKDVPNDDVNSMRIPFYFGVTSQLMFQSDVAVAVPGSSNLELFYRKKKTLILLPLDFNTKNIPLTGIPEFIGKLPGMGPIMKKKIINSLNKRKKWISLPNILMEREVFPELLGKVMPEEAVHKIVDMIQSPHFNYEIPEKDFPTTAVSVLTHLIQEKIL
ncbi:MAG: hypothetical protein GX428_07320 [Candidatus Atribacteria bacterium]|nr:hypothetical protein [Candidatus Atribacteria bacterium]